tara:strand:+ start:206 stop:595 length:390 start_codon:yes stop_codon:yes gene_type:complete
LIEEKGIGWRLVIDNSKKDFPILIGGDCISVELRRNEWEALVPLLSELIDQFKEYEKNFYTDEAIILEKEKDQWSLCLEGINNAWSLKLVFASHDLTRRGFQMYWPIPSAEAFVFAMRKMWDSYQKAYR